MNTLLVILISSTIIFLLWKILSKNKKTNSTPVHQPIEVEVVNPIPTPVIEKKKTKKVETEKTETKKPAAKRGPKKKVNVKK
jgi:hypothetical protein